MKKSLINPEPFTVNYDEVNTVIFVLVSQLEQIKKYFKQYRKAGAGPKNIVCLQDQALAQNLAEHLHLTIEYQMDDYFDVITHSLLGQDVNGWQERLCSNKPAVLAPFLHQNIWLFVCY